jgi:hypothetical protein
VSSIPIHIASPRKLPRPKDLSGRVVVLDIAFASEASGGGFEKITRPLIEGLGERLAAWVDHHDHDLHARYAGDPRFRLTTKAAHPACPELVDPELVGRVGPIDAIVCHGDFDGLCSAAKWLLGGEEPYPGADADARCIDTRTGTPSAVAEQLDRAIRAKPRDESLGRLIVRYLASRLSDAEARRAIDDVADAFAALEKAARRISTKYQVIDTERGAPTPRVAWLDASAHHGSFDRTTLLLEGQARAGVAVVRDRDSVTVAAPFDSGLDFLALFGLSGGMPTVVSVPAKRLDGVLRALGVATADRMLLGATD